MVMDERREVEEGGRRVERWQDLRTSLQIRS
jgi:hypothetical protein